MDDENGRERCAEIIDVQSKSFPMKFMKRTGTGVVDACPSASE